VRWGPRFGIILAAASFLIYAATVFALPQVRDNSYPCERNSIAAAVTNVVYGQRLGTVYWGVLDLYLKNFDAPLEQLLRDTPGLGTTHPTPPAGYLMKTTEDGNGVGYLVVASTAFRVFGLHAWALPLTMLILMALSAALFLERHSGTVALVVTAYFSALTVMLFTPLMTVPAYAINIPVAGIRYFSLLTVLPAIHILLDTVGTAPTQPAALQRQTIMLGVQVAILVMATLVRGSMTAVIAAIAVVACVIAWRHRGDRCRLQPLRRKATVMALTALGLIAAIALWVPDNYIKQGRFGTVIWHRITLSLGLDEAFPYPGLKEMFPCEKFIPEGILPGTPDRNGHCMWLAYVVEHHIPTNTIATQTYGGNYEAGLRDAFFKIAWRYPSQVLKTFLIVKPTYIFWSLGASLAFDFSHFAPSAISLLLASLAVLLVSAIAAAPPLSQLSRVAGVAILCAACTLPPLIAVWAMPHTSADLLLLCLLLASLALGAIPQALQAALRRTHSAPAPA
jgi:hypothetical protein